jgi:hypothetical protein
MSLDDFKKAAQPCFDAHADVAMIEREIARLRAALGETDPSESTVQ